MMTTDQHFQSFAPATANERSQWLDALRGFALLGILLYNISAFGGYFFRGLMAPTEQLWSTLDPVFDYLLHALVEGKFYSLFSFLFGLGFALQMRRANGSGAAAMPMLRRRMGWLLVFGLAHALLLWIGDILAVYAVFGFALIWFGRLSQRALLAWAVFFLLLPILAYVGFLSVHMGDPMIDPAVPIEQNVIFKTVHAIAGGSYTDVVHANVEFYSTGWLRRAVRLALPRIFGMFLLGVWAARIGLPSARDAHSALLRKWLLWGALLGIPFNLAYASLGASDALLPSSLTGLAIVILSSFGIPLLTLAYVAAFALLWRNSRQSSLLVSAGRTALSHYLGQSMICVLLFYGFGLGLFGRVSYTTSLLIAVCVFVSLAWLARAWLHRYPQGPMEALWRRLSYGTDRAAVILS